MKCKEIFILYPSQRALTLSQRQDTTKSCISDSFCPSFFTFLYRGEKQLHMTLNQYGRWTVLIADENASFRSSMAYCFCYFVSFCMHLQQVAVHWAGQECLVEGTGARLRMEEFMARTSNLVSGHIHFQFRFANEKCRL